MLNIRELLKNGPIILDGATGSVLQKSGMPLGVCPEQWILEHRAVAKDLIQCYIRAGSQIIYAPTFGANRIKLSEYGLEHETTAMNQALVQLAREAVDEAGGGFVAADMTMTGQTLKPLGPIDFEDLVNCYKEQARALDTGGVDLFAIETMMHIGEARAALLAVKEVTDKPVIVTMTVEGTGKTMYGTDMLTALITLQSMGADAVGVNCSAGPDTLINLISRMKPFARVPIIAKPNAGMPELVDGETIYNMNKMNFAGYMRQLVEAGAALVGGCCGTTPEYIALLKETVGSMPVFIPESGSISMLTSERASVQLANGNPLMIVGERINPTGKKALREALKQKDYELVQEMALSQEADGAMILDVNVGMNGIDEITTMQKVVTAISEVCDRPLCLDSSSPQILEAVLRQYHGRALVNSVSCEEDKLWHLLPVIKKYGAMFIMLPLTGAALPKNLEERVGNLQTIMDTALKVGLHYEDMVADGLVTTLGANPQAGLDTLETIRFCHDELNILTICGLSNISFGLPDRGYVNSTFLTMAIQNGLTLAIANPSQELLMRSAFAADLLMGKEEASLRYIEQSQHFAGLKHADACAGHQFLTGIGDNSLNDDAAAATKVRPTSADITLPPVREALFNTVLKGKRKQIEQLIQEALSQSIPAGELLNEVLIPAITRVGELFNEQKYFLPQLLMSAEAMTIGIDLLTPFLKNETQGKNGITVIIATVEGDIHDIGKNLVALMMKNHGFQVIDLGKDVPADTIVQTAIEKNADIIALSALMTTTMQRMRDVVKLARAEGVHAKIIIGGAVITQDYADEIGADGYSEDAVSAVDLVKRLMSEST